jgi:hypothetical protein
MNLPISKRGVLASFAASLYLVAAQSLYAADPTITIALYAAPQQESPLQILGFNYGTGEVQIEVSNTSSKPIVRSRLVAVLLSPYGCPAEKTSITTRLGGVLYPLRIAPHSKGITSRTTSPFSPATLIMSAKDLGAGGYLHVQVGVLEVDFADGTRWRWNEGLPSESDGLLPSGPFDAKLLEADHVQCPDAVGVRNAWTPVMKVEFKSKSVSKQGSGEMPTEPDAVPKLVFSCTLHESSAVCPWSAER